MPWRRAPCQCVVITLVDHRFRPRHCVPQRSHTTLIKSSGSNEVPPSAVVTCSRRAATEMPDAGLVQRSGNLEVAKQWAFWTVTWIFWTKMQVESLDTKVHSLTNAQIHKLSYWANSSLILRKVNLKIFVKLSLDLPFKKTWKCQISSIMKMPFNKKLDLSYASCSRLKFKGLIQSQETPPAR